MTSTTGTGASGEMRETLPQTNSSSMRSPTHEHALVAHRGDERLRARDREERHGAQAGSGLAPRGERHRSQQQDEHQHLGVAEIVLEQPGHEDRAERGEGARRGPARPAPLGRRAPRLAQRRQEGDAHPPEEEHEAGQPALGGDLEHVVVQVRLARVRRLGPAEARVDASIMPGPWPNTGRSITMSRPACHM